MSGLTTRIRVNLFVIVLGIVGISSIAFLTYAGGIFFTNTYEVTVPFPEAGGALPNQQVTVLGKPVGSIEDIRFTDEGVLYVLEINGDQSVPREAEVRVLRRSPIGEQSIDFTPLSAPWTPAEPGEEIIPVRSITPSSVPALLEEGVELLEAIGVEDFATIVEEGADALRGRGETLVNLNRELLETNTTLVSGIPQFDRLIATSDPVLTLLNGQADNIRSFANNTANLMETLARQQPALERIVATGGEALTQTAGLISNQRPNLQCIAEDLIDLNGMLTGPSTATGAPAAKYNTKLDELNEAFRASPFFWQAFDTGAQFDPETGLGWVRVDLRTGPPGGQPYVNPREVPDIRPGAACVTEQWGTGVNAVRQADAAPPLPTGEYDFAPLVAGAGPKPVAAPPRSGAPSSGGGGSPLPATGGGLVLLGAAMTGLALRVRRRA